ncbi:uncharacterized protein IWZ02DRAFT_443837 [Phyllosticta citriasiana]|uniref:uncharacterized protein n=1 Tax=Phyllosticta citriasiana TaxID=595635 RepID=UPI0030FDCB1E
MLSADYINLNFASRSSTSTSDSDLERFPVTTHRTRTMAHRDSPPKRRKTLYSIDDDDDEDEDVDVLLRRFQKKPSLPPASERQVKAEPAPRSRMYSHSSRSSQDSKTRNEETHENDKGNNGEVTETGPRSRPGSPSASVDTEAAEKARRCSEQRKKRDLLTVKSHWGDAAYHRYTDCSEGTVELLSFLSKRFREKASRYYIFNETLQRMAKPEPGKLGRTVPSRGPEITCGDVREAKKKMMSNSRKLDDMQKLKPPALKTDLLQMFKLRVGASGLLEPAPASTASPNQLQDPPKDPHTQEPVNLKSADSPQTPVLQDSAPTGSSGGTYSASSSGKKTGWKDEEVIDLTLEESIPATSKTKTSYSSAVITIDDSTSTGRSTPITNMMRSGNLGKTSAFKPLAEAVDTSDSTRPNTPLPTSKLKPKKRRVVSTPDATSSVTQAATSDMQQAVERTSAEVQTQTPPTPDRFGKEYSREDDCLMVYLKIVFGYSSGQIAQKLPGRTPGACATRYSTKLRHGQISLREAIDCLQDSSQFRHHLDPARHNPILNRLAVDQDPATGTGQPTKPAEMLYASMKKTKSPSHAKSKAQDLRRKNHPTTEDDTSDATGRGRARRKRPKVDYDVTKYFSSQVEIDEPAEHSSSEDGSVLPSTQRQGDRHIMTEILPKKTQPEFQKTYQYKKPYLASHERDSVRKGLDEGTWYAEEFKDWHGVSVHIGLSPQELLKLEEVALDVLRRSRGDFPYPQPRRRIEALMKDTTEAEVFKIAATASQRKAFPDRSKESIEAALRDAQDACLVNTNTTLVDGCRAAPSVTTMVRRREFGRNQSDLGVPGNMKTMLLDTIGPSMSFTGTSNDVNTVAWAPDGICFAAGSACHVDSESMQYNRANNLLFGSTHKRSLIELPEHHTLRERPESGPNSSHNMHVTQDRRLFQTVAAVCFSPDGRSMYSAGYDGMVRFWDVQESGPRQRSKMWRNAKIDLLTVSKTGLLATGAQRTKTNAITVFNPQQSYHGQRWSITAFNSRRAAQRPENNIYPSAIRFEPHGGELLLGGFASTSREEMTCGESCLWNIRTGTQLHLFPETRNVFDVAWNPLKVSHMPDFAVGCVAGSNVNRGVRSVVKMYDIRSSERCGMSIELDCPALDMNDVMFCPYDENLVVAGCTNGTTYVWDIRQAHPEVCLYSLGHDQPLMELADSASRERLDTGIRFCSWGHNRSRFYTGSSDGVVKSWDLYRARDDVLVRDVVQLNSGVMCGSFSPDFTSLLLGEVNGSINVLEVGKEDQSIRDADSFDLKPASDVKRPQADANPTTDDDSGVVASQNLVKTGQIELAPMGGFPVRQALQGPNYAGPFDSAMDADDLRDKAAVFQQNLASGSEEQCDNEGCNDIQRFTEEECGDSGRWQDRIPAAMSLRPKPIDEDAENRPKQRLLSGVTPSLKCSKEGCDRPVRPRLEDADGGKQQLYCERHDFGSLRPGHDARVLLPPQTVDNRSEGAMVLSDDHLTFRADVLGYRRLHVTDNAMEESSERATFAENNSGHEQDISRTWRLRIYGSDPVAQEHADDACGMDEWHASLWGMEEAPAAPPFLRSPPPSPPASRVARRDSPKYLGETNAVLSSPSPPGNSAQQGGGAAEAESTKPPEEHAEDRASDAMDLDTDSREQSASNALPTQAGKSQPSSVASSNKSDDSDRSRSPCIPM